MRYLKIATLVSHLPLTLSMYAGTVSSLQNDPTTMGTLPYEILNASNGDTITFGVLSGTINLNPFTISPFSMMNPAAAGSLPAITQSNLTIQGNGMITIDGNTHNSQAFSIVTGTVTLDNLIINRGISKGGDGGSGDAGGGGAVGGGGALYIHTGATATISNITFTNNQAIGGAGGNGLTGVTYVGGGGGGYGGGSGGNGTNIGNGGGGGGHSGGGDGLDGDTTVNGNANNGIYYGGGGGGGSEGHGGSSGTFLSSGGFTGGSPYMTNQGGGGGAGAGGDGIDGTNAFAGPGGIGIGADMEFGGGGGGGRIVNDMYFAGNGTGAGGGGGDAGNAGSSGSAFGGGGGGGGAVGEGSFGSGGGGGGSGGLGGSLGGKGGIASNPGGGGGAALGGAILVREDATLNMNDGISFSGSVLTPGAGGFSMGGTGTGPQSGQAHGLDVFLCGGGFSTPGAILNCDIAGNLSVSLDGQSGFSPSVLAGTINKSGIGTLTLISPASGSMLFNGEINVTGGTVIFDQLATGTFSGTISGTGTIQVSPDITFSGTTTGFTGTTSIADGTVSTPFTNSTGYNVQTGATWSLAGATAISSLTGNGTVNLGSNSLTVQNSSANTFDGVITGMGSLIKSSTGTLYLSGINGANTYSGGTTINVGGTLRGNTTSVQGTINDNGGLEFFQDTVDGTFSGTISGSGSLSKSGSKILTFDSSNTVSLTGPVDVLTGRLNINNIMSASSVEVHNGGVLGGTGTINASVTIDGGGRLSPGTSPGILTVGSAHFLTGSFFSVDLTPSLNSQLISTDNIPGAITIDGGVALDITIESGTYANTTTYTLMQATNGGTRVGTFGPINVTGSSNFTVQVIYPNSFLVQLILSLQAPSAFASNFSGNAGAVATAFATLNPNDPDIMFLNSFLAFASTSQQQCDYDQMHSARFNAVPVAQEAATLAVRATLTDRLQEIHGPQCEREVFHERSVAFWVTPLANFIKQSSRSQHGKCDQTKVGYSADTYGLTAGCNGALMDWCVVGGALSYANTDLDWNESLGSNSANSGFASLFGTLFNSYLYLDAAIIGAYDSFEAKRDIHLRNQSSKIKRTAKHDNHAGEIDAHLSFGVTTNKKFHEDDICWQLCPFFEIDYFYMHETGYHEKDAKSIDLVVESKNSDLLREEIGLQFSTWHTRLWLEWSEEIHLSYVREDRFKGKKTHEHFVHSSDEFTVTGYLPDRNLFAPGVSMSFLFPKINMMVSARYQGEFGYKWKNQTGSLQFLWTF